MTAGIIAEFNPFHNGHKYILQEAKKRSKCDYMVVALSGDFVQRGAPAIADKAIRTKAALLNGADMVVQLPVLLSTATAEEFALGGVSLLHEAGVDILCFGCETEDLDTLTKLARFFLDETPGYQRLLKKHLKEGKSFPAARALSAVECLNDPYIEDVLDGPNNILAIEYIKAILKLGIDMKVCPIKRTKVGHHSLTMRDNYASATALRKSILATDYINDKFIMHTKTKILFKALRAYIPKNVKKDLVNEIYEHPPITEDDMTLLLKYRLLGLKDVGVADYLDGSVDLSNRIYKNMDNFTSITEFCTLLNTKESTYARLSRLMMHIILGIKDSHMKAFKENPVPYVRVLGFRRDSSILLGNLKQNTHVPVITSVKESEPMLSGIMFEMLKLDIYARQIYLTVSNQKNKESESLKNDYSLPMTII